MNSYFLRLLAVLSIALCGPSVAQEPTPKPAPHLAATLQPFVDRHELAGAVVLVASKEKVLTVETVGFADIAGRKAMPQNALFWIASQTKPFTATALMMLVDEGKVAVDDPVEKYLPEFKGQMMTSEKDEQHVLLRKPSRPIAVRDVLSHTSGLPYASSIENPTLDGLPLHVAVRSYAMLPLQWEPGSRYQYSNAGLNTAGRIIEVVSGMPYEQFLQKRILEPLGLRDTTFWPNAEQLSRLAKAYKPNAAKTGLEETTITQLHYPVDDHAVRFPMPAGGLFSTAVDLARFCQMIMNGGILEGRRYLSEAAVKQMTSRQTAPGLPESYGFGWSAGDGWAGHGGAVATNMTIDFAHGLVFIYMVQHNGFPGAGAKAYEAFRKAALEQFGAGPARS
jgi:CubicO group peptidase (beta-lactamase class C family)